MIIRYDGLNEAYDNIIISSICAASAFEVPRMEGYFPSCPY